ncbi:MAG: DinB family protein [Caldilineaceae bacterium]
MKLSQMFAHWEQIRTDLLATIDKFSEQELTYAPYPGCWPVGKLMAHIADCEDYWLHAVVQPTLDPNFNYELVDYPTKAAIKELLNRAHERTLALLDSLDERNLSEARKTRVGKHLPSAGSFGMSSNMKFITAASCQWRWGCWGAKGWMCKITI